MSIPIVFVEILTRQRIAEELEAIHNEITDSPLGGTRISSSGVARLAELRRAIEHKPIDIDPQ